MTKRKKNLKKNKKNFKKSFIPNTEKTRNFALI